MDRMLVRQRDFSSGQIDETAARRDDSELHRSALRQARNVRLLNSGGVRRRPGRKIVYASGQISYGIKAGAGSRWWLDFNPGQAVLRLPDGSAGQLLQGLPWTADMVPELEFDVANGTIIVAHQTMKPQVLELNPATNLWSARTFQFASDFGSVGSREPFYAFQGGQNIQMKPSARTGAIVVGFDAPVLSGLHLGARFRYAGVQMVVTQVNSPQSANMTVVGSLPPTLKLTVDTLEGFQLGDVVEGVTSGASGFITSIVVGAGPTFVLEVIMNRSWQRFELAELIAGPRSKAEVKAVETSPQEPAPSLVWDESFISDFRGYPGSVTIDRQRLIFSRFRQFGGAICYSAIGSLSDFLVGPRASDAIFEYVPQRGEVLYVTGGEDQFVFTDTGVYFTPISAGAPLAPGSIDYRRISNDAVAPIRPKLTGEGTVFVNSGRNRVLAIVGTGQQTQPYVVRDLTQNHSELIRKAQSLTVTETDRDVPERYLYVTNADGTMAVARYDGGKGAVGWVPWDSAGVIQRATALEDLVAVTVRYGETRFLETFDETVKLDATLPAVAGLTQPNLAWAAGRELAAMDGGWFRGSFLMGPGGVLPEPVPSLSLTGVYFGLPFDVVTEPFVPNAPQGEGRQQSMRPRKITRTAATVLHSTAITVAGRLIPMWEAGENQELAPPVRSDTYRGRVDGRSFDPRWTVEQTIPGEFTLLELATEVTV